MPIVILLSACGTNNEEAILELKDATVNFRYQERTLYWNDYLSNIKKYDIQSANYGTSDFSLFYTYTPSFVSSNNFFSAFPSTSSKPSNPSKIIPTVSKYYRIRACFNSGVCTKYSPSIIAPPINSNFLVSSNTTTQIKQGSITGGNLVFTFAVPSSANSITMSIQLAGNFYSFSEKSTVYFNNNNLNSISSDEDGAYLKSPTSWQNKTINPAYWIPGKNSIIKFDASSDVSYNSHSNFYYKYQVTLHYTLTSQSATLAALDLTTGTLSNTDNWLVDSNTGHYNGRALKNPETAKSESKCFQIAVPNNVSTITFYWKISAEFGDGELNFYINNTKKTNVTPSFDWSKRNYNINSNDIAKWCYSKNSSISSTNDGGWVDRVSFE